MGLVQPMRIEEDINKVIELKSMDENINKTTAIKQFLYIGVEDYLLRLCSQGRISIGKAAEIMQTTLQETKELFQNR